MITFRSLTALALATFVGLGLSGGAQAGVATPGVVHFGNTPVNTSATQGVTITADNGFRTEVASGSGLNAPFSFDFDSCGAGGGFAGPGDCNVNSTFHPTGFGAFSGTVNVFECPVGGGSCQAIPYTVDGTGISVRGASMSSVDFGQVPINTTATVSIDITVDAGYRTEVASGSGLNAPFQFNFGTCGDGGGFSGPGTCTIQESYTPTAVGANSGTLTVFECPIVGGSCLGIPITVAGEGISIFGPDGDVDFGDVPVGTTATLPVGYKVDAGYRTEVASGSGLNAPFGFDFDSCGASGGFAGPGTCSVNEKFTPTVLGLKTGSTTVFECPIAGGSCIGGTFGVRGNGVEQNQQLVETPEPGGIAVVSLLGLLGFAARRRAK